MKEFLEKEFQGEFWISGKDNQKTLGSLFINGNGVTLLKIKGKNSSVFSDAMSSNENFTTLGIFKNSYQRKISLFDCHTRSVSGDECEIVCSSILIGLFLNSKDSARFIGLEVRFGQLPIFTELSGLTGRFTPQNQKAEFKYRPKSVGPFDLGNGVRLSLSTRLEHTKDVLSLNAQDLHYLKLEFPRRRTIEQIEHELLIWQSFLSFSLRRPIYCKEVLPVFRTSGTNKALGDYVIIQDESYFQDEIALQAEPLITRKIFGSRIKNKLSHWRNNFEDLQPVIELLVGAEYQRGLYSTSKFLSYTQALETFHRRVRNGEYQSAQDYNSRVYPKLVAAIPSRLNSRYKDSLKARMKYHHEWSLRRRLQDLFDFFEIAIDPLFQRNDMGRLVDIRNYLTHYSTDSNINSEYLNSRQMRILTRKVRFFVEVCLLYSIGMRPRTIRQKLNEHNEFDWLSREQH